MCRSMSPRQILGQAHSGAVQVISDIRPVNLASNAVLTTEGIVKCQIHPEPALVSDEALKGCSVLLWKEIAVLARRENRIAQFV